MSIFRKISVAGFGLLMTACATQEAVQKDVAALQVGPTATPHRTITNFSDGLRCMDNMMIAHDVRDVSMLVEDLDDRTTKVNAGTKDMLITAVSQMTRRSRSIRLVPFGNDSGNLIAFLNAAGSSSAYNVIPQYDIRGSISQLDANVANRQLGASVAADKWGVGASMSAGGSILGIDLSILTTSDLSVLPGVTSSNAVVLFKTGKGADTDATIKSTGINFDFSVSKNDATVQALRNLIELASIELVGRLVKLPYWECLHIPAETESVQREIEDWYYAMLAHNELPAYVRSRLYSKGHYPRSQRDAGIALTTAVRSFQRSNNVPETGQIDLAFFKMLLTGDVGASSGDKQVADAGMASAEPPVAVVSPALPVAQTTVIEPRLTLAIRPLSSGDYTAGDVVNLSLESNQPAYVYCYFNGAQNDVQRFFPNRFESNNLLEPGRSLSLPGDMGFDIIADARSHGETVHCFASRKNVFRALPPRLTGFDFESLAGVTINDIREAFMRASDRQGDEASFTIAVGRE